MLSQHPENYRSDAVGKTVIQNESQGGFREHLSVCPRTRHILEGLSRANPPNPHPVVLDQPVLRPEFLRELGDTRHNENRVDRIPRFLLVDLNSFRFFSFSD